MDIWLHTLIRFVSMLHCAGLQQVAEMDDESFEIIDNDGIQTAPKHPPWSCLTLELSGNFQGTLLRQLQGGCIGVEMAAERSQT